MAWFVINEVKLVNFKKVRVKSIYQNKKYIEKSYRLASSKGNNYETSICPLKSLYYWWFLNHEGYFLAWIIIKCWTVWYKRHHRIHYFSIQSPTTLVLLIVCFTTSVPSWIEFVGNRIASSQPSKLVVSKSQSHTNKQINYLSQLNTKFRLIRKQECSV